MLRIKATHKGRVGDSVEWEGKLSVRVLRSVNIVIADSKPQSMYFLNVRLFEAGRDNLLCWD